MRTLIKVLSNTVSSTYEKLGVNIEEKNFEGQTALADAIIFSRIETIKLLLLSGANPKVRCSKGVFHSRKTKDKYGFSCIAKAQLKGENIKNLLVSPTAS